GYVSSSVCWSYVRSLDSLMSAAVRGLFCSSSSACLIRSNESAFRCSAGSSVGVSCVRLHDHVAKTKNKSDNVKYPFMYFASSLLISDCAKDIKKKVFSDIKTRLYEQSFIFVYLRGYQKGCDILFVWLYGVWSAQQMRRGYSVYRKINQYLLSLN